MKNDEYKKVSRGLGQEIRNLMGEALVDARYLMGRRELNERLMELLPADDMAPVRGALATRFKQYAEKGQDRKARFELRGRINEFALHVVTEMEKGDAIVAAQEEEVVDLDAAVRASDEYSDRIGGKLDRKRDQERAEAQEILRRAGYTS